MTKRFGVSGVIAALLIGSAMPMTAARAAGPGAPGPGGPGSAKGAPGVAGSATRGNSQPSQQSTTGPQLSQDAAARSRMHECGHQWSSMKKAGTTGMLTWKEFSSTCLVVSR